MVPVVVKNVSLILSQKHHSDYLNCSRLYIQNKDFEMNHWQISIIIVSAVFMTDLEGHRDLDENRWWPDIWS